MRREDNMMNGYKDEGNKQIINYGENMKVNSEQAETSFQVLFFKSMLFIHLNSFNQISHFTKPAYS